METTYVTFTDVDVDGCGTNISALAKIDGEGVKDGLTNGIIARIKQAITDYKASVNYEYDTDGCLEAAQEQLKKEGLTVSWIQPSSAIDF